MESIWLGLSSYEERHENWFKGREKDTSALFTMLEQNDCVVLYAASGEGKSSIINAGLSPRMRRNSLFPIKIGFTTTEYNGEGVPLKNDGKDVDFDSFILSKIQLKLNEYKENLVKNGKVEEDDFDIRLQKSDKYADNSFPDSLWWRLRTETIHVENPFDEFDYIPVLIFDQFEEIFQAKWKASFFTWMETLLKDIQPDIAGGEGSFNTLSVEKQFKVMFSLRYEYVGELDYWCSQRTFIPQMMRTRYFLKPLRRRDARKVMEQGDFDEQTIDEVIKSLSETDSTNDLSDEDAPCISALMLSIVCTSLFSNSKVLKNDLNIISQSGKTTEVNEIIKHITQLFYLQSIENLTKRTLDDEGKEVVTKLHIPKRHLQKIEKALVDEKGKRIRIGADISPGLKKVKFARKYMDSFAEGRIITVNHWGEQDNVELVHDKLAEVVYDRIHRRTASMRRVWMGVFLAIILIAVGFGALYFGTHVVDPWESSLASINHPIITSDETLYFKSQSLENVPFVEEFRLQESRAYIENCNSLNRIIIDKVTIADITIDNCPQLKEIIVPNSLYRIDLSFKGGNNINCYVSLPKDIESVNVYTSGLDSIASCHLEFNIPQDCSNLLWKDNILWDLHNQKILYANPTAKEAIAFPDAVKESSLSYNGKTFNKLKYRDEYEFYYVDSITKEYAQQNLAKKVIISSRIKYIEPEAFMGIDSLLEVVFQGDSLEIGARAFAYCPILKSVQLPKTLPDWHRPGYVINNSDTIYYIWAYSNNPFFESNNIENFNLPAVGGSFTKNNDGLVIWKDSIYAFFEKKYTILNDINVHFHVPQDIDSKGQSYFYKNGVFFNGQLTDIYVRDKSVTKIEIPLNWGISHRLDLFNIGNINRIVVPFHSPQAYYTKDKEKYSCERYFAISDSIKSHITLVVPHGSKRYYEFNPNYVGFKNIEESPLIITYWNVIKNSYFSTLYYFENWGIFNVLLFFFVLLAIYTYILTAFMLFEARRRGKERINLLSLSMSLILFFLLAAFSYTAFYWFAVFAFNTGVVWSNVWAIIMVIVVTALALYLRYVAGKWDLFIEQYNALFAEAWHELWKAIKSSSLRNLYVHLKLHLKAYAYLCVACLLVFGSYNYYHYYRDTHDLEKMIEEKNWEKVSDIVYERLMDKNNVDSITQSWARTLLINTNQEAIKPYYTGNFWGGFSNESDHLSWREDRDTYMLYDYQDLPRIERRGATSFYEKSKSYITYKFYNNDTIYVQQANDSIKVLKIIPGHSNNLHLAANRYLYRYTYDKMLYVYDLQSWTDNPILSEEVEDYIFANNTVSWYKKDKKELFCFDGETGLQYSIPIQQEIDYLTYDSILGFVIYRDKDNTYWAWHYGSGRILKGNRHKNYISDDGKDSLYIYTDRNGVLDEHVIPSSRDYHYKDNYLTYEDADSIIHYYHPKSKRDSSLGLKNENLQGIIMQLGGVYEKEDSLYFYRFGGEVPILVNSLNEKMDLGATLADIEFYENECKYYRVNDKKGNVNVYNFETGQKLKTFPGRNNYYYQNGYLVNYVKDGKKIMLFPFDNSPFNVPIVIYTQKDIEYSSYTQPFAIKKDQLIIRTNESIEIYKLPSLEESIKYNKYLSSRQKRKLLNRLSVQEQSEK